MRSSGCSCSSADSSSSSTSSSSGCLAAARSWNDVCCDFLASSFFLFFSCFSFLFSLRFSAFAAALASAFDKGRVSAASSFSSTTGSGSDISSPSNSRFRFSAFSSMTSLALLCDAGSSFARLAACRSSRVCFFPFFCHCVCRHYVSIKRRPIREEVHTLVILSSFP